MSAERHLVLPRHVCGAIVVLLLLLSRHVAALSMPPVTLRNWSVAAFDLLFMAPLLIGCWRGGTRRKAAKTGAALASGSLQILRFGPIAVAGALAFASCYLAGPLTPRRMDGAWFAALRPLLDLVQAWSPNVARIQELAATAPGADAAALAGYNLVLLWIVPGLTLVAGFLCRWSCMTAPQAAWQCAANRARFASNEVLRKTIDRIIVVLFVWNLPMADAVSPDTSPAVEALARSISYFVVAGRPMVLLLLCCMAAEWLFAELALNHGALLHLSRPAGRSGFAVQHHR